MLADVRLYKVIKLARSERGTAKSITSADNELIGERSGKIRGRVLVHCDFLLGIAGGNKEVYRRRQAVSGGQWAVNRKR